MGSLGGSVEAAREGAPQGEVALALLCSEGVGAGVGVGVLVGPALGEEGDLGAGRGPQ